MAVSVILKYNGKYLNIDTTKKPVSYINFVSFSDEENRINEAKFDFADLHKKLRNQTPVTKEDAFELWLRRNDVSLYCGRFRVTSVQENDKIYTVIGNGVNSASLIKKQNSDMIYRDTSAKSILKKIAGWVGMDYQYLLPQDYPIMSLPQDNRTYGQVIREVAEIYCGAKSHIENNTIIIYSGANKETPKVLSRDHISENWQAYSTANEVFGGVELTWNPALNRGRGKGEIIAFYGNKNAKTLKLSNISFPNINEGNRLAKNIYFAQNTDIDTLTFDMSAGYKNYYGGDYIKAEDFSFGADGFYGLKSINYSYDGKQLLANGVLEREWRLDT